MYTKALINNANNVSIQRHLQIFVFALASALNFVRSVHIHPSLLPRAYKMHNPHHFLV